MAMSALVASLSFNKFVALHISNYNLANKSTRKLFCNWILRVWQFDVHWQWFIYNNKMQYLDTYLYHEWFCLVSMFNQCFYQFSFMGFLTIVVSQWKRLRWIIISPWSVCTLNFDSIVKDFVVMDECKMMFFNITF